MNPSIGLIEKVIKSIGVFFAITIVVFSVSMYILSW